jgi:hypothetical protein
MIEPTSLPPEREVTSRTTIATQPTGFDRPFARISWGAIFAGAIIALASQFVLTLIGMAIGLAAISPATGTTPSGTTFGVGATVWVLLSSLISLFIGGYIAGRLGGTFNGWLHGLAAWGLVTLSTVMLLTTAAGALIGAGAGLASFATSNANQASSMSLPPAVQQQLDQLKAQASQSADELAAQAQQPDAETQARAREVGQRAAKGGAVGAGGAALALILGALAAAGGGRTGQRYPVREVYEARETRRS